jgi:hypothetical protein
MKFSRIQNNKQKLITICIDFSAQHTKVNAFLGTQYLISDKNTPYNMLVYPGPTRDVAKQESNNCRPISQRGNKHNHKCYKSATTSSTNGTTFHFVT